MPHNQIILVIKVYSLVKDLAKCLIYGRHSRQNNFKTDAGNCMSPKPLNKNISSMIRACKHAAKNSKNSFSNTLKYIYYS